MSAITVIALIQCFDMTPLEQFVFMHWPSYIDLFDVPRFEIRHPVSCPMPFLTWIIKCYADSQELLVIPYPTEFSQPLTQEFTLPYSTTKMLVLDFLYLAREIVK